MTWAKRRAIIIVTLFLFLAVILWAAFRPSSLELPSKAVLVIDAGGDIEEQRAPDFFSALSGNTEPVLHDYTDALDSAATDSHITGVIVRIAPLATGWGKSRKSARTCSPSAKAASPASATSATTESGISSITWQARAKKSGWCQRHPSRFAV